MKLVKLPTGAFVNADKIDFIDTDKTRSGDLRYFTTLSIGKRDFFFSKKFFLTREEAQEELRTIPEYIERYLSNSTVQKKVDGILK